MKGSKEVDIQGQGRRRDKLCPASIKYAIHSIKVAIIVLVSLNINKNIVCAHCSSVLSGSSRWEWGILTLVTYSLSGGCHNHISVVVDFKFQNLICSQFPTNRHRWRVSCN